MSFNKDISLVLKFKYSCICIQCSAMFTKLEKSKLNFLMRLLVGNKEKGISILLMSKGIDVFWLPKYAESISTFGNSLTHVFPLFGYDANQIIINMQLISFYINKINKM